MSASCRSFYVGDAAGRKNDHSDADIQFAKVLSKLYVVIVKVICHCIDFMQKLSLIHLLTFANLLTY